MADDDRTDDRTDDRNDDANDDRNDRTDDARKGDDRNGRDDDRDDARNGRDDDRKRNDRDDRRNGDRDRGKGGDRSDRDKQTDDDGRDGKRSGDDGDGSGDGDGDQPPEGGWKGHARTWEKRARENKSNREKAERERDEALDTLGKVRKAFGLDQDDDGDEQDPKRVAEQAQQLADERAGELRTVQRERAAEKAGRRKGADVDALLDSRDFAKALDKLDPEAESFSDDLLSLIDKTLDDNPRLKADQSPPPSSEDMTGGGESRQRGDSDEPDDIDEIRKQRRERRES